MVRSIAILGAVFLGGCFGSEALSQVSAGYTGCPADEIVITNDESGWNERSWDASCRGRTFHCAGVSKAGLSCTEDRPAAPPAPIAATSPARPAASLPPAHAWERFAAKDCGLSFLLPGQPEEQRDTVKTKAGPLNAYTASVDVGTGAVFVGCTQLPPTNVLGSGHILDGARDGALAQMGASFESEFDLQVGDFKGREVSFTVQGERGRLRLLRRGRQIVTMGLAPNRAFSNAEAKRFFDTLELPAEVAAR